MRLPSLTLLLCLLLAASASAQVSSVSVDTAPSAAAGARTVYRVSLTVNAALTVSDSVRVLLPGDAGVGTWQSGTLRDVTRGADVGSCGQPNAQLAVSCTLFSGQTVQAGNRLQATLRGITNPASPGNRVLSASTTAEPQPASSSPFAIVAGGQVSQPTLALANPSAAAGAVTRYVVRTSVSATGGLSGDADSRVTVTLPPGTGTDEWQSGTLRDLTQGADVGSCSEPVGGVSSCGLFSGRTVAGGAQLEVVLRGLTNGPAGAKTVSVSTSSDLPAVSSPAAQVVAGNAVTTAEVTIAAPSAATGALTRYVLGFNVSATGGLSGDAGSSLTVTLPAGTGAEDWQSATVRDVTRGADVGSCGQPVAGVSSCWLFSGAFVDPGDRLQITLRGLTNGSIGSKTLSVRTSSDLPAVTSQPFQVLGANAISTPTVAIASPSAAAGALTRYVVGLRVSATGGLSGEAGSEIAVTLPANTGTDDWQSGTIRDLTRGVDVGSCGEPADNVSRCGFFSGAYVNPGDELQLVLRGLTNAAAGAKTVSVTTSSDPTAVTSAPFQVVAGGAVSQPTVAIAAPSAATGALTRYVVGLTLSGTGGLSADAGSRIDVTLPAGTGTASWQSGTVRNLTRGVDVGSCGVPTAGVSRCGFFSGAFANPGDELRLTLRGLTNGPAGTRTVSVSTTSDRPAVASSAFAVTAAGTLAGVSVRAETVAPQATTRYVVRLATSATGGLSAEAGSSIRLVFPAGTGFAAYENGTVYDASRAVTVGTCGTPAGLVVTCGLFSGAYVDGGDVLRISFPAITNPAAAGALSATTSSDTPSVSSGAYQAGEQVAPETTITAGGPTFTFSSSEPGTFECRIDGGAFFPCASPYTPSGLPAGEHRFEVRAVDSAGNPDETPAERTFGAAQPTPTPTSTVTATPTATPTATATVTPVPTPTAIATTVPTATPTPTATPNAEPVEGTVKVKRPGSDRYEELPPGTGIPLGSTVDTKRGAVRLRAVDGGEAVFSDGIFRLTRSGAVTVLTLTEPLAPCAKARASVSRKKAKSRKLWGDGKGAFRTQGKYSAATVRGTRWLVQDSCAGTLTKVAQGAVTVRDQVKGKTVVVRAGRSYRAKPKR